VNARRRDSRRCRAIDAKRSVYARRRGVSRTCILWSSLTTQSWSSSPSRQCCLAACSPRAFARCATTSAGDNSQHLRASNCTAPRTQCAQGIVRVLERDDGHRGSNTGRGSKRQHLGNVLPRDVGDAFDLALHPEVASVVERRELVHISLTFSDRVDDETTARPKRAKRADYWSPCRRRVDDRAKCRRRRVVDLSGPRRAE